MLDHLAFVSDWLLVLLLVDETEFRSCFNACSITNQFVIISGNFHLVLSQKSNCLLALFVRSIIIFGLLFCDS